MRLSHAFLVLCIPGPPVRYAEFVTWLAENGADIAAQFDALLVNGIARFFAWDVAISAIAVIVATCAWRERLPAIWPPIVATLLVSVSFGLPLLLYLAERGRERTA